MRNGKDFFREILHSQAGYMTIEMTMIFPALFFALILILFMGMVLYQEVNVQSLAVRASERGAVVYGSRVADMTTGVKTLEDFKIRDPYRNVPFMDGSGKESYTALVNRYVADRIGDGDIISGSQENGGNYAWVEDYLIAKRVNVKIHTIYPMPVESIAQMFGQSGTFDVSTQAASAVVDSPDFVRNVDIVTDLARQTEVFETMQSGYQKIREAIEKAADLLQ